MKKPSAPSRKAAIIARALEKLIVHKISFSNMGEKAGSPVGGKKQTGKWKFDCRWNPNGICKNIGKASLILKDAKVTRREYPKVLADAREGDLFFVDPPYVDAGGKCYKHSFMLKDHIQLAEMLGSLPCAWVLTYDYHPLILNLYSKFAHIYDLEFNYFMSSAYRTGETMKVGKELLITNIPRKGT
jgi:DNA adenine methylase